MVDAAQLLAHLLGMLLFASLTVTAVLLDGVW